MRLELQEKWPMPVEEVELIEVRFGKTMQIESLLEEILR